MTRTSSDLLKLSLADVEAWKRKGYSQSEIARMYGVSRQWVSLIVHNYGGSRTPRQVVMDEWPFEVPAELCHAMPYKRLRDHAEYVATRGKGMSEEKLKRLRGFYERLRSENAVVEFDPAIPPITGVSSVGGWALRKRKPSDHNLLIRVNKHTSLSEKGEMIWAWPLADPP
jgi:transcriptional regulator with XRE-family HTH domain